MSPISFHSCSKIITKNLSLRFLEQDDARLIFELQNCKDNQKYLHRSGMKSLETAQTFIKELNTGISENKYLYWGICKKNSPEIVGTICVWSFSLSEDSAELGYELLPQHQGQGIMTEAMLAIISFSFKTLELKTLKAHTNRNNLASCRLLEKNNFRFIRLLEKIERSEQEQNDEIALYTLNSKNYYEKYS